MEKIHFLSIIFGILVLSFATNIFADEILSSINDSTQIIDDVEITQYLQNDVEISGKSIDEPVFVKILKELLPETLLDWVLIFANAISIVLVLIVGAQTWIAKRDNEKRMRPWIRIEDPIYDNNGIIQHTNGNSISWSKFWADSNNTIENILEVKVHSSAFNGGTMPTTASRIQVRTQVGEQLTKETLLEHGTKLIVTPIMPQEKIVWRYAFSGQDYVNCTDSPIFVGAECIYKINKKSSVKIGKIWKLGRTSWEPIDYWFEEIKINFDNEYTV